LIFDCAVAQQKFDFRMGKLSITTARDAWHLLRGVTCVYKPPDYAVGSLKNSVKVRKVLCPGLLCDSDKRFILYLPLQMTFSLCPPPFIDIC
jgi:hypothetical protein